MKKKNFEVEIAFNMKRQYNYYLPLCAWIIIFIGYWFLPKHMHIRRLFIN